MKARLNITIDDKILTGMKAYANSKRVSISELVEEYFKSVTKPAKRKNIITLVEKLKKPGIGSEIDLKEAFYQKQAGKYGF